MPKIQQGLESVFGKQKVLASIAPDEVVAVGTCQQAMLLRDAVDVDGDDDGDDDAEGAADCVPLSELRTAHTVCVSSTTKALGIQKPDGSVVVSNFVTVTGTLC